MAIQAETLALRASRSENLGLLPQIAAKVSQLANNPSVSLAQIEHLIEHDVALASKLLKVANSSYYGGRRVASIGRAVQMLGLNQVKQVTMSVAYQQLASHKPSAPSFNTVRFWGHSLAVAVISRSLARQLRMADVTDELYVAGLLHDLGILILDRLAPEILETTLKMAHNSNRPLHVIEGEILGFDHAALGAEVARVWGFEDLVVEGIRNHHNWKADASKNGKTTALVSVANALAAGNGILNQAMPDDVPEDALQVLGVTPSQVELAVSELIREVVEVQTTYGLQVAV